MGFDTHDFLVAMMADSTMVRLRMQNIPAKAVVLHLVRPQTGVVSKDMDALPKVRSPIRRAARSKIRNADRLSYTAFEK
jgi:hypothetical protein